MKDVKLFWQTYKMFPYEKVLGRREVETLLQPEHIEDAGGFLLAKNCRRTDFLDDLVYFSSYIVDGHLHYTLQAFREQSHEQKQNTRYFAHGIHEYKGKFNPQIVRAILNICGCSRNATVLDPFCGSGTSLLEAQLQGCKAYGIDINPMAVFIAGVKTKILSNEYHIRHFDIHSFMSAVREQSAEFPLPDDERMEYLKKWFRNDILVQMEAIRDKSDNLPSPILRDVILLCTSNVLRDYSEQEPSDLRVRRRNSPYPDMPFLDAVERQFQKISLNLFRYNSESNVVPSHSPIVVLGDIKQAKPEGIPCFDIALTSPPYATALPYIDTQRLSIVWLELDSPKKIRELERSLIGSREVFSKEEREALSGDMRQNRRNLSPEVMDLCNRLQDHLTPNDGFRKQHTPLLLYKYFHEMSRMFHSVYSLLKAEAYYCLVVGYNKTSIGGGQIIDTPSLLAAEAVRAGFNLIEVIPLEAYQRYGIHAKQSITSESLIILRK